MAATVVIGGQYGSEGKGKLLSYLACRSNVEVAMVRCGGSNAGHTATGSGQRLILRQLPSGVVRPDCQLFLSAGMVLDLPVLLREIDFSGVGPARLMIDSNAVVLGPADSHAEEACGLNARLGSTLSGTGYATARKVLRAPDVVRAADVHELRPFIGNVADAINDLLDREAGVIVEGTQGFGLSLHHGTEYPYVTSRDTTAAAFLSEAGISPLQVSEIVMVLRTYPIRVAGNSGPMYNELSWDEVTRRSGYPVPLSESTTVTKRIRRVGEFDWDLAARAVKINRPTRLALHGADYISYDDLGVRTWSELSRATRSFVTDVEHRLGVPVDFVFTGPDEDNIVDRRGGYQTVEATVTEPDDKKSSQVV